MAVPSPPEENNTRQISFLDSSHHHPAMSEGFLKPEPSNGSSTGSSFQCTASRSMSEAYIVPRTSPSRALEDFSKPTAFSSSQTTPPSTQTRDPLGPLTSTFLPPRDCFFPTMKTLSLNVSLSTMSQWGTRKSWYIYGQLSKEYSIFDTQECTLATSATKLEPPANVFSCYPPAIINSHVRDLGHFYSPGLACPSGYSGLLTVPSPTSTTVEPGNSVNGINIGTVLVDETIVVCCPS